MRQVRPSESAVAAIAEQLTAVPELLEPLATEDLIRGLLVLAESYDELPHHGPGRRYTDREAKSVAFFHLFTTLDDERTVVVYHVDLWVNEPPERPDDL